MQLGFIIFYKIISLRSVPHNQAKPTANPPSPINCCKQIQNGAVWDLFYARMQCLFYRLGHPPSFYSGVIPGAVINYFALYSEAGSLPRLKLRTDATPFSSQSGKADFPLKRTPPLYGSTTFRLQEELLNGQCPGERTDRAGLCKAHKARLCELERNPRQPTVSSSCSREAIEPYKGGVPFRVESAFRRKKSNKIII